ncbi:MAG: 30S ribosomal protein S12 methylthiotransferase RimO [Treponema sp.]|nr:30S ribosomal protein S12 methylthiotransferase RimO [Treponema sp.]
MRYYIDPFGCAKNQVDAENMMAALNLAGWTPSEPQDAELIIINSCGFIESAKQESINAVLEWRKLYPGKKIMLAGCLAQRYEKELKESLPEADLLFGNSDLAGITKAAALAAEPPQPLTPGAAGDSSPAVSAGERPLLSFPGSAYVKISEGCDNRCSFCAIPLIRGNLKSRDVNSIFDECKSLLKRGIWELNIIGQDIGSYGRDFSGLVGAAAGLYSGPEVSFPGNNLNSLKMSLPGLMEKLSGLNGDFWVRLLYIHPDHFPLPILDLIGEDKRFLQYFDLPFQHGSKKILGLMNRRGNAETYLELIHTIRQRFPDAVIRSTFLTGFPGETDEDFNALVDFQEKAALDWAGCFAYSREEDTSAYSMKPQVPKKTALQRKKIIEDRQISITEKQMDRFVGRTFDVLFEEKVEGEEDMWLGRLPFQAPEVDGAAVIDTSEFINASALINDGRELQPGVVVKGKITGRAGMDMEVTVL